MAKLGSPEWRANISAGRKNQPGRIWTVESRLKLSLKRRGQDNPNWKGESATLQAGRARAGAWFAEQLVCARCGERNQTERHHRDGNPLNNERDNVRHLCRRCHMIEDGRMADLIQRNRASRVFL